MDFAERVVTLPGMAYLPAHVRSLLGGMLRQPVHPTYVQIEPTQRCNLRCIMCVRAYCDTPAPPDMSFDMFRRILDQIPDTLEIVTTQGLGEPLMNRELLDMVRYARQRNLWTRFNTNLTLMNEEIAEALVDCGHGEIQVSIETIDPDVYADIRRGARLDHVLENLQNLIAVKRRKNSETPEINVIAILMKPTIHRVGEFVRTLKGMGVAWLHFIDLNLSGLSPDIRMRDGTPLRDITLDSLPADEVRAILQEIKSHSAPDFRVSVPYDPEVPPDWGGMAHEGLRPRGILTCKQLWEMPYITCDGYVTPCCFQPAIPLGNLNEKTFREIWFSKQYRHLRLRHLLDKHPHFCRECARLCFTLAAPSKFIDKTDPVNPHNRHFVGLRPR